MNPSKKFNTQTKETDNFFKNVKFFDYVDALLCEIEMCIKRYKSEKGLKHHMKA